MSGLLNAIAGNFIAEDTPDKPDSALATLFIVTALFRLSLSGSA
jgi:hypothetical protein